MNSYNVFLYAYTTQGKKNKNKQNTPQLQQRYGRTVHKAATLPHPQPSFAFLHKASRFNFSKGHEKLPYGYWFTCLTLCPHSCKKCWEVTFINQPVGTKNKPLKTTKRARCTANTSSPASRFLDLIFGSMSTNKVSNGRLSGRIK